MKTNYQIITPDKTISNCEVNYWKSIKETKAYELVDVNGIEYKRSEVCCNIVKFEDKKVDQVVEVKHNEPVDEFQTVKFMILSRQIGKVSTYIYNHPCPDISEFWKYYKIWAKKNLADKTLSQYLNINVTDADRHYDLVNDEHLYDPNILSIQTKKRIEMATKIYEEYKNYQLSQLPV